MAVLMVQCCRCDVCGHTWVLGEQTPRRCSSCKSMRWNHEQPDEAPALAEQPRQPRRSRRPRPILVRTKEEPTAAAIEQPEPLPEGAVRCRLCNALCSNAFALKMHACYPAR